MNVLWGNVERILVLGQEIQTVVTISFCIGSPTLGSLHLCGLTYSYGRPWWTTVIVTNYHDSTDHDNQRIFRGKFPGRTLDLNEAKGCVEYLISENTPHHEAQLTGIGGLRILRHEVLYSPRVGSNKCWIAIADKTKTASKTDDFHKLLCRICKASNRYRKVYFPLYSVWTKR